MTFIAAGFDFCFGLAIAILWQFGHAAPAILLAIWCLCSIICHSFVAKGRNGISFWLTIVALIGSSATYLYLHFSIFYHYIQVNERYVVFSNALTPVLLAIGFASITVSCASHVASWFSKTEKKEGRWNIILPFIILGLSFLDIASVFRLDVTMPYRSLVYLANAFVIGFACYFAKNEKKYLSISLGITSLLFLLGATFMFLSFVYPSPKLNNVSFSEGIDRDDFLLKTSLLLWCFACVSMVILAILGFVVAKKNKKESN